VWACWRMGDWGTRVGVWACRRVGVGFEREATFLTEKEVLPAILTTSMCDKYLDADTPIRRHADTFLPVIDTSPPL
jgi:hypothetical protein